MLSATVYWTRTNFFIEPLLKLLQAAQDRCQLHPLRLHPRVHVQGWSQAAKLADPESQSRGAGQLPVRKQHGRLLQRHPRECAVGLASDTQRHVLEGVTLEHCRIRSPVVFRLHDHEEAMVARGIADLVPIALECGCARHYHIFCFPLSQD